MSGWAQREAERQEDDEQEIDLSYERFKKEALQDPETRKEYDRINNNSLTWQDQPTENGYYWFKEAYNGECTVVRILYIGTDNPRICYGGGEYERYRKAITGKWYGPIKPPEED